MTLYGFVFSGSKHYNVKSDPHAVIDLTLNGIRYWLINLPSNIYSNRSHYKICYLKLYTIVTVYLSSLTGCLVKFLQPWRKKRAKRVFQSSAQVLFVSKLSWWQGPTLRQLGDW